MAQKENRELKVNGSAVKAVPFPKSSSQNAVKNYIEALYEANEASKSAQLEAAYERSNADLRAAQNAVKEAYKDQYRRDAGSRQQANAGFGGVANAYGLNTGAGGQAALLRSNQTQTANRAMGGSYANANEALERQKEDLRRGFERDMDVIAAENEAYRSKALLDENQRMDASRLAQAQAEKEANAELFAKQVKASLKQKEKEAKAAAKAAKSGKKITKGEVAAKYMLDINGGRDAVIGALIDYSEGLLDQDYFSGVTDEYLYAMFELAAKDAEG